MEAGQNASDRLKRLHTRYEKGIEDFTTKFQEEVVEPNTNSPVILDRSFLKGSGDIISEQAIRMLGLNRTGKLNAKNLEECIRTILEILNEFYRRIARAQFIALDSLVGCLHGPMTELTYRSQILLERSLSYGPNGYRDSFDGLPELAKDVFNAYKSCINEPNIRASLIMVSIFDVAEKSDSLPETEEEGGSVVQDCDLYERLIKDLMTGVVCSSVLIIKDMPYVAEIQDGADLSKIIPVVEDILKTSKVMRDCVNEIKKYFSPLREDRILQALQCMKNPVSVLEQSLQNHYPQRAERCISKIRVLNNVLKLLEEKLVESLKQKKRGA